MVIEVWNKMDKVCNTTAATPESDFEVLSGKVIAESTAAPVHPSLHGLSDDWLAVPAAIVPTSALHRKGIRGLIRCLSSIVAGDLIEATCSFRYDQGPSTGGDGASANGPIDVGKWTGQIYRQGEVVSAEYSDSGVEIRCKLPEALYNKLLRLGVVEFEH
jgi:50S ribosomal subunit-associated GTPase HflX